MRATNAARSELDLLERETAELRARIARAERARDELEARISGERRTPWSSAITYVCFALAIGAGVAVGPRLAERVVRAEIEETLGVPRRPCDAPPMASDAAITLERTECYEGCPVYTVTLHADGRVEYLGVSRVGIKGRVDERIDPAEVRSLFERTMRACFASAHDEYPVPASDRSTAFVTVSGGAATKRVRHYPSWYGDHETDPAPPQCWSHASLTSIERDIDRTARTSRWVSHRTID